MSSWNSNPSPHGHLNFGSHGLYTRDCDGGREGRKDARDGRGDGGRKGEEGREGGDYGGSTVCTCMKFGGQCNFHSNKIWHLSISYLSQIY